MTMKLARMIAASTILVAAAMLCQDAEASDWKFYSAGGCTPYTTGTPNYNLLRFRPESVQNQSTGYLYVICPIVRDSEDGWMAGAKRAEIVASFRTNTAGNFQCTLNYGSNATNLWTSTKSVSGNPGDLLEISWTADTYVFRAPASLVCRLPPKGSLVRYYVNEFDVTDKP